MLNGLLSIIQMLWCYMGESILGEQSTKDWILNHKVTVLRWISTLIVVGCFLVVLENLSAVKKQLNEIKSINSTLTTSNNLLINENNDLKNIIASNKTKIDPCPINSSEDKKMIISNVKTEISPVKKSNTNSDLLKALGE